MTGMTVQHPEITVHDAGIRVQHPGIAVQLPPKSAFTFLRNRCSRSAEIRNQVRYWGIRPSFGLLKEPETNGVVERWNRTLKEQAVYGRVFQNLADVRAAVAEFVERYNRCWRLEKLAYRTPLEAREEYELRQAA